MKKSIVIIFFLALLLIPASVLAATASPGNSILGGTENDILKTALNILTYPIDLKYTGNIWGLNNEYESTPLPLWIIVAVFTIVFSIFWLASGQVPLFKNENNTGARKAFVIALDALTIFTTPVVSYIGRIILVSSSIGYVLAFVLLGYTMWTIFKGGWAGNRMANSQATKTIADARRNIAEAKRDIAQTNDYMNKTKLAEKTGVKQQKSAIKDTRQELESVLKNLQKMRKANSGYFAVEDAIKSNYQGTNAIIKSFDKISADISKIISFKNQNDRLMSGMSKADYKEKDSIANLGSKTYNQIDILKNLDTETNDFARIITGIVITIKKQGITEKNINQIILWTTNAINICNRMERDIVAETTMLEQM